MSVFEAVYGSLCPDVGSLF